MSTYENASDKDIENMFKSEIDIFYHQYCRFKLHEDQTEQWNDDLIVETFAHFSQHIEPFFVQFFPEEDMVHCEDFTEHIVQVRHFNKSKEEFMEDFKYLLQLIGFFFDMTFDDINPL